MSRNANRYCAIASSLGFCMLLMSALKVLGVTDIAWVWVLSPWWVPLVFVVLLIILWSAAIALLGTLNHIFAFVSWIRG